MRRSSFLVLAAVTLVVVIAAIYTVLQQRALTTIATDRERAFETLADTVNNAAEIDLVSSEAKFKIVKTDTGWGMEDRAKYPVHFDKVKSALVGLAELKLLEAKTSDASRYARLQVEEPDKDDAQSVRFEIKDGAGKVLANGIIGKQNPNLFGEGGGGTYLRRGNEAQSWLAEGEVTLGKTRNDWLVRDVVNIQGEDVSRAVIRQPDGAEIVITKS